MQISNFAAGPKKLNLFLSHRWNRPIPILSDESVTSDSADPVTWSQIGTVVAIYGAIVATVLVILVGEKLWKRHTEDMQQERSSLYQFKVGESRKRDIIPRDCEES